MKQIHETILKRYTENVLMKSSDALENSELIKEYFILQDLLNDFVQKENAYEVANTIKSFNYWNLNKDREPVGFKIKPKDVFYIDLGAFNIKYEESFLHSCLVIKKYGTMVLVVAGSSKKYGKNNFLIEDVQAGDGFRDNTGLFIDQIRCVSVTRIKGKKIGEISDQTFDRVKNKIIEAYFPDKHEELKKLKIKNDKLEEEIENITLKNIDLEKSVSELQDKISKLENKKND